MILSNCPSCPNGSGCSPSTSPDTGFERGKAEALLSDVAIELLRLPFESHTRPLHLRALELKRRIGQWGPAVPSEDEQRTMREIRDLQVEAETWRAVLR